MTKKWRWEMTMTTAMARATDGWRLPSILARCCAAAVCAYILANAMCAACRVPACSF
jgi:hypothetical protein